ncbi:hypothetical protein BXZ70DRAFT_905446 [Cristinia sonorae]|uniref:Uncharacterized protein n=1 Tax=Cristinia sonorae TaxID=1940300 RepID=A0A8K0UVK8_9AGAR|nr:hypothetical protein BXZ70DRAFT_905446 [Cristinia sonorae]
MSVINIFPREMLDHVLVNLEQGWTSSLCAASLVCTAWRASAQPILLQHIEMDMDVPYLNERSLLRTLHSSTTLRRLVKKLSIQSRYSRRSLNAVKLYLILRSLPRLQYLELSYVRWEPIDIPADIRARMVGTSLKAAYIHELRLPYPTQGQAATKALQDVTVNAEAFVQLMTLFASIDDLRLNLVRLAGAIYGVYEEAALSDELNDHLVGRLNTLPVETLDLRTVDIATTHIVRQLIGPRGITSFHGESFPSSAGPYTIQALLDVFAPTLQFFSLCLRGGEGGPVSWLSYLPSIRATVPPTRLNTSNLKHCTTLAFSLTCAESGSQLSQEDFTVFVDLIRKWPAHTLRRVFLDLVIQRPRVLAADTSVEEYESEDGGVWDFDVRYMGWEVLDREFHERQKVLETVVIRLTVPRKIVGYAVHVRRQLPLLSKRKRVLDVVTDFDPARDSERRNKSETESETSGDNEHLVVFFKDKKRRGKAKQIKGAGRREEAENEFQ